MAPDYNQFYLVLELKYEGSYPPQADREMELDSFCPTLHPTCDPSMYSLEFMKHIKKTSH
jgi:hypothetical protein